MTVVRKEFADHLTNRTFLVLAVLLLVVCILPFQQGLAGYRYAQEAYADPVIDEWGFHEPMLGLPNAADVYFPLPEAISTAGAILAIAMGFDLVSRERQTGSLKMLLVRPIFRDEVITGKALGVPVLVIGDNPASLVDPPACLSDHVSDVDECVTARDDAVRPQRISSEVLAAEEYGLTWVDTTNWFCTTELCPLIIGNVLVLRDETHITVPMAEFLTPLVGAAVSAAL